MTKHQLAGASWQRLGRGLYAWREIADTTMAKLTATMLCLPSEHSSPGALLPGSTVLTFLLAIQSKSRFPQPAAYRAALG